MIDLPLADREARLRTLEASGLLDAPPSRAFDRVTALVRRLLDVPVSLVSLVDRDRQFFLSQDGLPEPWAAARETPLSHSFCQHVVAEGGPVRVEDAPHDPTFCGNLAVRDLDVVGYLGVPVRAPDGAVLGSLCAITPEPRAWTDADMATLEELAAVVEGEVALQDALRASKARAADQQAATDALQLALDAGHLGRWGIDLADGRITQDARARAIHGLTSGGESIPYQRALAMVHPDDRGAVLADVQAAVSAGVGARIERTYRVVGPGRKGRWARTVGEVREGADGPQLVGVTWDVTDEREAEVARRRAARRKALLLGLLRGHRQTSDPHAMMAAAAEAVGRHLGAHRVEFVRVDGAGTLDLGSGPSWADGALVGPLPTAGIGEAYVARMQAGEAIGIADVGADPLTAGSALAETSARAVVSAPILRGGRWVAGLHVLHAEPRTWADHEVALVRDVADQVWDAVERAEAEAAVRRSEAHLRAVLDGLSAFVAVLSPTGVLIGVNRPVTEVSGVRTPDVAGVPFWEGPWWVHEPEAQARIREACRRAAGGEASRFDTVAEIGGGERLPIDFSVRPLIEEGGRVTHLVASAIDISDREAATAALRESEARYRTLFESVDVGVCLLDMIYDGGRVVDYRFVSTNPAFVAQTGLEDADGRTAYELVPDLERQWVERYAAVAETGEALRFVDRSDAMGRTFDVYAVRVGGDESRRVALLFTDISEREAAAEALRQSRQRLQIALETARLGTFEHDLAADTTACDARTQEILGLPPDPPFENLLDRIHPDDREAIAAEVARLRTDPATGPLRFRYRTVVDGATGHVAASIRGETGPDGRLARVIGAVQDVTDWVEAEAAVRESEARFEMALQAAGLGTWDWDLRTDRVVYGERWAAMLGYGPDELAPELATWQRLLHPDDRPAAEAAFEAHLAGRAPQYEAEFRMRAADGGWRWVLSRGEVVERDAAGDALRAVGLHLDVTDRVAVTEELERRVAERTVELERSNAELDQFAYVASHDLKAPIRAIDSLATWIAEDAGDALPEPSARHLALLRSRASRMEGLLDSLLTYSRVGRKEAAPEPVDTRALVADAVATVAPPEGFDVRVEGAFPEVETARTPLELVVRNLVGNAIKHHDRPDGRVVVSAEAVDGWATFAVADDGPGIDPAYQDRVFGLFQTLRPRDEVEGSGMGLSIVRKAVEARGGWVTVASDGRGTTFRFTWPLRPDVSSSPPAP